MAANGGYEKELLTPLENSECVLFNAAATEKPPEPETAAKPRVPPVASDPVEAALVKRGPLAIDMKSSTYEELQVARIYTRNRTELSLAHGYQSGDDVSDEDEEEGKVFTERYFHENGALKFIRTYQPLPRSSDGPPCERVVEEKHFDPGGACMMEVHFGLGQPYLSRKHFWPNSKVKSEKLFFVEDERTMKCRKAGHWRTYYPEGCIESEVQYDHNGIRVGFCKRYAHDGSILWCKDYTKEYIERANEVNSQAGRLDFTVVEAAKLLGFPEGRMPKSAHEVNREYRRQCTLLHPDKSDDPKAGDRFVEASKARDLLLNLFEDDK